MRTSSYLEALLKQRNEANCLLLGEIRRVFKTESLATDVRRALFPGRKVRSILFLKTLGALRPDAPIQLKRNVIFSIEAIHGGSVLVDDVLDEDHFRHGQVTTEARWGINKSILFAHLLSAAAIGNLAAYPEIQQELVKTYQRMCLGEMHDVFVIPGDWITKGYNLGTIQKTSALFRFALWAAKCLAGPDSFNADLATIGEDMGMLYQLSNDLHDWQVHGIKQRHKRDQAWRISFGFPLAVYILKHNFEGIDRYMKKAVLSYDEWLRFVSVVWRPDVKTECELKINRLKARLLRRIHDAELPQPLNQLYTGFVQEVITQGFWYHSYDMSQEN